MDVCVVSLACPEFGSGKDRVRSCFLAKVRSSHEPEVSISCIHHLEGNTEILTQRIRGS
jgi:hypothetical protein